MKLEITPPLQILSVLSVLLFNCSFLLAQVEVGTNNKVSIGPYTPISTIDLTTGSARFNGAASFMSNISLSGCLGIGIAPNANYKLSVKGFAQFLPTMYYGIIIDNTGYYGMAIYPQSDLTCNLGQSNRRFKYAYAGTFYTTSDERLKENIRDISGGLDQVLKLKPVKYDIKKEVTYLSKEAIDEKMIEKIDKERVDNVGFLAQDLQKICPSAVQYDDSTDAYNVNYLAIIPILVNAIQEQNDKITALEAQVKKLTTKK